MVVGEGSGAGGGEAGVWWWGGGVWWWWRRGLVTGMVVVGDDAAGTGGWPCVDSGEGISCGGTRGRFDFLP